MFGNRKFNDIFSPDRWKEIGAKRKEIGAKWMELGAKWKTVFKKKSESDESDATDEIKMEHVDLTDDAVLIRSDGDAPDRKPLLNPEAMPKGKVREKKAEKTALPSTDVSVPVPASSEEETKKKAPVKVPSPSKAKKAKDASPLPLTQEEKERRVRASLDGMYDVYRDPEMAPDKPVSAGEFWRYAVLFVCIFGFLTAGIFVFGKLLSYHRAYLVNTKLQELVSGTDRFQSEYLKKNLSNVTSLTPQDILNGKKEETTVADTYTEKQQNLVNKIHQLKKINSDTAGWITINGTVVNYPVVWSEDSDFYLRHDFYGKTLASGTLFIDERNSPVISENRNTVIYGHNMGDGSMFASLHDFTSANLFHRATIEIATEDGIYVYKPFSAHESDAYDNYFETDFESDEEFLAFCDQMQFLSPYQTDTKFDKNSKLLTLSTCKNQGGSRDRRYAVHAILVKVIR